MSETVPGINLDLTKISAILKLIDLSISHLNLKPKKFRFEKKFFGLNQAFLAGLKKLKAEKTQALGKRFKTQATYDVD